MAKYGNRVTSQYEYDGGDIHDEAKLEAHSQVKSASVERQFPNILKVSIKECDPVMRMRVMGSNDQTELRVVSRSGTIYKGEGYTEANLNELPYLQPYQNSERGFKKIRGIEQVAELLDLTRRSQPNFYKSLKKPLGLFWISGDAGDV